MTRRLLGPIGGPIIFFLIAGLVFSGLGWVTVASLRVEEAQREAAAQAELSNNLRIALWRLDGRMLPSLGVEDSRPYHHYATYMVGDATAIYGPASAPLLATALPDWMRLHFQVDPDTGWQSPQVLTSEAVEELRRDWPTLPLRNTTPERVALVDSLRVKYPARRVAEVFAARELTSFPPAPPVTTKGPVRATNDLPGVDGAPTHNKDSTTSPLMPDPGNGLPTITLPPVGMDPPPELGRAVEQKPWAGPDQSAAPQKATPQQKAPLPPAPPAAPGPRLIAPGEQATFAAKSEDNNRGEYAARSQVKNRAFDELKSANSFSYGQGGGQILGAPLGGQASPQHAFNLAQNSKALALQRQKLGSTAPPTSPTNGGGTTGSGTQMTGAPPSANTTRAFVAPTTAPTPLLASPASPGGYAGLSGGSPSVQVGPPSPPKKEAEELAKGNGAEQKYRAEEATRLADLDQKKMSDDKDKMTRDAENSVARLEGKQEPRVFGKMAKDDEKGLFKSLDDIFQRKSTANDARQDTDPQGKVDPKAEKQGAGKEWRAGGSLAPANRPGGGGGLGAAPGMSPPMPAVTPMAGPLLRGMSREGKDLHRGGLPAAPLAKQPADSGAPAPIPPTAPPSPATVLAPAGPPAPTTKPQSVGADPTPPPPGPVEPSADAPAAPLPAAAAAAEAAPIAATIHLGSMRPHWLTALDGTDALVLVRAARLENKTVYQGVVLDWSRLQELLKDEVKDLFPEAKLLPAKEPNGMSRERIMTALPVQLDPGPSPTPPPPGWTPLRFGLVLAWAAAVIAFAAVGLCGWSLIDLAERRIRFVSAVTHELRTPLTAFRLYIDLLLSGLVQDEEKRKEYLSTLNAESDRLHRLIDNVLDFARLERRRKGNTVQPIKVAELLTRVQQTWTDRCEPDGKELVTISTLPPESEVCTDADLVQQIVGNLIDNARKYTRDAADNRIWVWAKPGGRNRVVFEVEDRGAGVPPRERGLIFRPFRRGESAETKAGGAGLGLALCKQWAEVLGGRLTYRPAEGEVGSCFRLELPVK